MMDRLSVRANEVDIRKSVTRTFHHMGGCVCEKLAEEKVEASDFLDRTRSRY